MTFVPETVGTIGPTFGAKNYSNIQEVMQGSLVPEVFVKAKRAQSPTDDDRWEQTDTAPTINQFDVGETRATVLIPEMVPEVLQYDGYNQKLRVNEPGNTVRIGRDSSDFIAHAVAIQNTVIGRSDTAGPAGPGHGQPGDPMFTLDTVGAHAVATDMVVRRLTPLECERLMGWPDNHTLYRADGKTTSDTNRYKMCGNGVASPVAAWVAHQLTALL
jgi:site-specific DNA-cytosine methylase